jgi:glycosyltransferase involved in cell wall biosynthesis
VSGLANQKPWLTVVLPIYCGEEWIGRTLDSIAAQAMPGIEILLIDSSPTSGTADIARTFEDRLALTILRPEGLDGCSPKTNFGVEHARAEHVTWLCQDDFWLPGRAQAVRAWIEAQPLAVLHLAPTAIVDRNDVVRGIWRGPLSETGAPLDGTELCKRLLVQNFVAVASPVIRRDAWLACGGIDVDLWYTGDWDLWLKLAQSGAVFYHDAVTAAFRIHGSSATSIGSRDRANLTQQLRTVLERHIGAIPKAHVAAVMRLAETSILVNVELAAAANGELAAAARAAWAVLALGPAEMFRYLYFSRIVERSMPRLSAKLAGLL